MTELESRVSVLESRNEDLRDALATINVKLDALTGAIQTRQQCPSPGSCISLEHKLKTMDKLTQKHSEEIEKLARWQTYVFGACATIVAGWSVGFSIFKMLWNSGG